MTFTFSPARKLSPEEYSPMQALISRALEGYGKGVNASYLKKQREADLFAKEIGPLAALASNPNFRGFDPNTQKMIADRISGYLGGRQGGEGMPQSNQESPPGYANSADIYNRLAEGSKTPLSEGGQLNVAKSRAAGAAQQWGLPKFITEALGGNKAVGENAKFETSKDEAVKDLVLRGYTENQARNIINQKEGESPSAYANRVKPFFVNKEPPQIGSKEDMNQGDKTERNNDDLIQAAEYSEAIKAKKGKDISPDMILKYKETHPGTIHYPTLLKWAAMQ